MPMIEAVAGNGLQDPGQDGTSLPTLRNGKIAEDIRAAGNGVLRLGLH